MGYTTDFVGSFKFDKKITDEHATYINNFSDSRRMKRDVKKLIEMYKGKHGLNGEYGVQGEFFNFDNDSKYSYCNALIPEHQGDDNDKSVIDFNKPPSTQPGLWCQWIIEGYGEDFKDESELVWDGGEKFEEYIKWLEYLLKTFFIPWGYTLNGEVEWVGEKSSDLGKIVITNNVIKVLKGKITYE